MKTRIILAILVLGLGSGCASRATERYYPWGYLVEGWSQKRVGEAFGEPTFKVPAMPPVTFTGTNALPIAVMMFPHNTTNWEIWVYRTPEGRTEITFFDDQVFRAEDVDEYFVSPADAEMSLPQKYEERYGEPLPDLQKLEQVVPDDRLTRGINDGKVSFDADGGRIYVDTYWAFRNPYGHYYGKYTNMIETVWKTENAKYPYLVQIHDEILRATFRKR